MQKIDGTTIELTRGDILELSLSLTLDDGTDYTFQTNDKIVFSVYNKKQLEGEALMLKEIIVEEPADSVDIILTTQETKIGPYIDKPVDYWYEVELNDKYTVIGYDDLGPKILRLYPEGSQIT